MGAKEADLQCDPKACLFSRGVGIFGLILLSHFLTEMRSFCAHQKGNFLNFSKLNLLLFIVHFWYPQWPVKHKGAFFQTPCTYIHNLSKSYFFKYCKEATKVAKEVTRELTEKAIIIRHHLKNDVKLVTYMLRSHAASDYYMGQLLKGSIVLFLMKIIIYKNLQSLSTSSTITPSHIPRL